MTGPTPSVKEAHLAGRWYPADAEVLARTVRDLLASGGPPRADVVAVIVPHAAFRYSGATAARGLAAAGSGFERVIILAPSHFASLRGAALLAMSGYRTPLGTVRIDAEGIARLQGTPLVRANPAVFMREHAVEIELPLLQGLVPAAVVLPVVVGTLDADDARTLGRSISALLGPGTLLVVSSDMTHYGRRFDYLPVPPTDAATVAAALRRLDDDALDRIVACDAEGFARWIEETGGTICGRHPIEVLLHALPPNARGERIAYATSLDVDEEWDHAVSYAAVAFTASAT